MRTVVQVFTGGWDKPLYTAEAIVARLREITAAVAVEKVILGWHPEPSLYREVGAFLKERGIEMLLWLPVFTEIGELTAVEPACDVWGRSVDVRLSQEGETFSFACPSSAANREAVRHVYQTHFEGLPFTGVFLDRVRTQSFLGGVGGGLSCGCTRCEEVFSRCGVSLEEVRQAYGTLGDRFFDRENERFCHETTRRFFDAKARLIAASVGELCDWFHGQGLTVGLDVFTPSLGSFVGQDYERLAAKADFLKPMLYRRTDAPAGVGYEYERVCAAAPRAQGYPPLSTDAAWLKSELKRMAVLPCAVYPGVEINRREDIAPTDAAYVLESAACVKESGLDGITLSWDAMLAPSEHWQVLRDL